MFFTVTIIALQIGTKVINTQESDQDTMVTAMFFYVIGHWHERNFKEQLSRYKAILS